MGYEQRLRRFRADRRDRAGEPGGHPATGRIALNVNGASRQVGDLADQIWPVPDIIATLSKLVALAPGDLI